MNALDQLLDAAQPGYEAQVSGIALRLRAHLDTAAFEGCDLAGLVTCATAQMAARPAPAALQLQLISDLASLDWWCGLATSEYDLGGLAALARKTYRIEAQGLGLKAYPADPAITRTHAVFTGPLIGPLHSPTRGLFDYACALAGDPENLRVEVFHGGVLTPELETYARDRLGDLSGKVRFVAQDPAGAFLAEAAGRGPCTFHFWCAPSYAMYVSLLALMGPTVMFTCGDIAPVQYADAYWYCHEEAYVAALWDRFDTPPGFTANYTALESCAFNRVPPARRRSRADLGFGQDETVIVTAGNRLSVDMDQTFVDGMGRLLLAHPKLRWVVVGGLQDALAQAFHQVLGARFTHVPFDADLASLLGCCDLFANPFRAGGGNTAVMAIDAGCVVLTRDDAGDVRAFTPPSHRASDAKAYFAELATLAADPVLRAARLAEQQALLARRLDQTLFARELRGVVKAAFQRFKTRAAAAMSTVFGAAVSERSVQPAFSQARRVRGR